jgi:hypothetical protein
VDDVVFTVSIEYKKGIFGKKSGNSGVGKEK